MDGCRQNDIFQTNLRKSWALNCKSSLYLNLANFVTGCRLFFLQVIIRFGISGNFLDSSLSYFRTSHSCEIMPSNPTQTDTFLTLGIGVIRNLAAEILPEIGSIYL